MKTSNNTRGFTLIELLVVVIIIGILGTLVAMTYGGVQTKNRNKQRQANIDTIQSELETYNAQYGQYPTLANLNDASWRKVYLKDLKAQTLQDPQWSSKISGCTVAHTPVVASAVTKDCYAYQVTNADGTACDNSAKNVCAHYTLTALLEDGQKYVKASLN